MVDMEWKAKLITSDIPTSKTSPKLRVSIPTMFRSSAALPPSPAPASSPACGAYEEYLRLPELRKLWSSSEFPSWSNETILKPSLHALEITFRFISTVLSDPRPYSNRREWIRRLEALSTNQVELIAILCEDDVEDEATRGMAPIIDMSASPGVLARDGSVAEVWKLPGEDSCIVVNHISESSLLPRLATWQKSHDIAEKIFFSIECEMRRCTYTLGLGEPNLNGKPTLAYDAVCEPSKLHALKKPSMHVENHDNLTLFTTYQLLEAWIFMAQQLVKRIVSRIENKEFEKASSDCWVLERVWKLLSEIEDLHLLVDPDDFLRVKNQLGIKAESDSMCFRSVGLIELMQSSKDLKHKVPAILEVEVDPKGGPRIQEAAMKLYRSKDNSEKIHLLQGLQAVEAALKRFFFAYKQMLVVVVGSLDAKANRVASMTSDDSLSQIFMEPTYFPSLDAAKTFLGDFWSHECGAK